MLDERIHKIIKKLTPCQHRNGIKFRETQKATYKILLNISKIFAIFLKSFLKQIGLPFGKRKIYMRFYEHISSSH